MTNNPTKAEPVVTLPEVMPGHWETETGSMMARDCLNTSRSALPMGDISDFAFANEQYMASRDDLKLIVYQTAAKERIRWLSAQLALANMRLASQAQPEGLRQVGYASWLSDGGINIHDPETFHASDITDDDRKAGYISTPIYIRAALSTDLQERLDAAIASFSNDPADTDYQHGYRAVLIELRGSASLSTVPQQGVREALVVLCAAIDQARNTIPDEEEGLAADVFAKYLNLAQMKARAALAGIGAGQEGKSND